MDVLRAISTSTPKVLIVPQPRSCAPDVNTTFLFNSTEKTRLGYLSTSTDFQALFLYTTRLVPPTAHKNFKIHTFYREFPNYQQSNTVILLLIDSLYIRVVRLTIHLHFPHQQQSDIGSHHHGAGLQHHEGVLAGNLRTLCPLPLLLYAYVDRLRGGRGVGS